MGTSVLVVSELTINFENGMGYVESHLKNTEIWHCNSCTVHVVSCRSDLGGCYAAFKKVAA